MSEAYILLLIILALGAIAKNTSVMITAAVLLVLKIFRLNGIMTYLDAKGIDFGLTIMMVGLLAPVAMGKFGVSEFSHFLRQPIGIVAVLIGIAVTLFARQGIVLMASNPTTVPMAIAGIIIGTVVFNGVPVGPLVASGLTAVLFNLIKSIWR